MATPANAAIRDRRRLWTVRDVERQNLRISRVAAEHSRRQFILNFASTRDKGLLLPGGGAQAIKAAEEWATAWFKDNGLAEDSHVLFRYTVDERLWSVHGMPVSTHF